MLALERSRRLLWIAWWTSGAPSSSMNWNLKVLVAFDLLRDSRAATPATGCWLHVHEDFSTVINKVRPASVGQLRQWRVDDSFWRWSGNLVVRRAQCNFYYVWGDLYFWWTSTTDPGPFHIKNYMLKATSQPFISASMMDNGFLPNPVRSDYRKDCQILTIMQ